MAFYMVLGAAMGYSSGIGDSDCLCHRRCFRKIADSLDVVARDWGHCRGNLRLYCTTHFGRRL